MQKLNIREKSIIIILSAMAYIFLDVPVRFTGLLPSFTGIKNFLPFTSGLFFGLYGVSGNILGCIFSSLLFRVPFNIALYECFTILITGTGIFYGWHFLSHSGRIFFRTGKNFLLYILLVIVLSGLCLNIYAFCAYSLSGILIALPLNILFSSLLYIEPVMPHGYSNNYDAEFYIESGAESLESANEIIEDTAAEHNINIKRVFELQSCLEELTIRIINNIPDAKINVMIQYGEAISAKINYAGKKYNPLRIEKHEDEIDIMSLKIIKHRALRASYSFHDEINYIHVVV